MASRTPLRIIGILFADVFFETSKGGMMEQDFKTRRLIAVITSIVALVILVFFTRCSEPQIVLAGETATQMSVSKTSVLEKKDNNSVTTVKKKTTHP
jgi:hypothetical protein